MMRVFQTDRSNTQLAALARKMRESEETPPRQALRRAIARGELPPSTDPHLMLTVFFGGLRHMVLLDPDLISEERIDCLVDLVLYGALSGRATCDPKNEAVPPLRAAVRPRRKGQRPA
jgi:hypothetical protein